VSRRRGAETSNVWQIIYMDLMTTMMVFFVILWSVERGHSEEEVQPGISPTVGDQTVRMVHLPGDVLFASGRSEVTASGREVFEKLLGGGAAETVLSFDSGGLVRRQLVIHGYTDSDGPKDDNFQLGYRRAWSIYKEIARHSAEVPDHVVLCTHADNSPVVELPAISGPPTAEQREALRAAKAKNRRIAIEDQMINQADVE
jgi:flagellar motor protein MotB